MKFNAIQKYLLKVYAIAIIILTIIIPTYTSGSNISYSFIIFGSATNISFSFILIEYLALTLALVASILGTASKEKK
jgi:hypothetical protein